MNQSNKQAAPVAIITGSGRRIGAAIAHHLHTAGFRIVIHCHHSHKAAQALANDMNQRRPESAIILIADLSIKQSAETLINDSIKWGKRLDLLVNNASVFANDPVNDINDALWETLFTVNVKAPFCLSQLAFPHLAKQGGSIINITDIHADRPLKGYSAYCQSKAALNMQTKSLAREFAPKVRVNAIAPGAIAWPEHDNALSEELQQNIIEKTPLKRHGDPTFIAQAVLAISENPFITGQILAVDGGRGLVS